ncbi:OTU domain-containing protein 5 [Hondaea fermentalgiana]|uniref:ubiquitinyl hydrolase 1 n=1 Tax=Hondaea fermentalgiana TaxID=2315210 RepID=A0A2R5G0B2_9STRA|nr:OTU domain-containing protein 5 [Hondaea fermentalgiana]|eukprot:GBG24430.1 OTU domain-containing protein 5 [Hondaea fermentalgiana]
MGNGSGKLPLAGEVVDVFVSAYNMWAPGVVESVDPKKGTVSVQAVVDDQEFLVPIARNKAKSYLAARGQYTGGRRLEPEPELSRAQSKQQYAAQLKSEREAEALEEARAKARARPKSKRRSSGVVVARSVAVAGRHADNDEELGLATAVPDYDDDDDGDDDNDKGSSKKPAPAPVASSVPLPLQSANGALALNDDDMALMQSAVGEAVEDDGMVQFTDVLDKSVPLVESYGHFGASAGHAPGSFPPPPQRGWRWRPAMVLGATDNGRVMVRYLDVDSIPREYPETGEVDLDDGDTFSAYETMSSSHIVHHSYAVDDVLDVEDHFPSKKGNGIRKKWRKCQIVALSGPYFIRVTFVGWSKAFDAWFHVLEQADRLAPFGSHTEKGLESSAGLDGVFLKNLQKDRELTVYSVEPDGNCLFRAVAHQVYGDSERHDIVRSDCCDYLEKNRERFAPLLGSDQFDDYVANKRQLKVWGDDPEIRAMEELYDRPVEIYAATGLGSNTEPLKLHFEGDLPSDSKMGPYLPIRISFHGNNHYNSVIPYVSRQEVTSKGRKVNVDVSADAWEPPAIRTKGVIRKYRTGRGSRRLSGVAGYRLATQNLDEVDAEEDEGKFAD